MAFQTDVKIAVPQGQSPGGHRWLRRICAAVLVAALAFGVVHLISRKITDAGSTGLGSEPPKRTQAPYTIVVDPGHGGTDTGAEDLIRESDTNWSTATVLQYLLETEGEGRFNVVLTKTYDETVTPRQRAEVAQAVDADLLISIHCNSAADPETRGFECYPVPNDRKYHDLSMLFGQLLSEQMGTLTELRGTDGLRYAYYEGEEKVLCEISEKVPVANTTFTVLEESNCPAVLAEQCFVTNADDVAVFGNQEGAWVVARCYFNAIMEYFDEIENEADSQ